MSATEFTPDQLKVRKDTLDRVLHDKHDQTLWINEGEIFLTAKRTGESEVPMCGTAACAAGHAVLSVVDGIRVHDFQSAQGAEIQYRYDGKWLFDVDLFEAIANRTRYWDDTALVLLGLDFRHRVLFEGRNTHLQVVYSLWRLTEGLEIVELGSEYADWDGTTVRDYRLIKPSAEWLTTTYRELTA